VKLGNGFNQISVAALIALCALTGCSKSYLSNRQTIDRAHLADHPVDASSASALAASESATTLPLDNVTGTYTFTVPPTMTLVKEENGDLQRYQIFAGQPAPEDKPIVTITLGNGQSADSATGAGGLTSNKNRTYLLNNIPVQEWQGYTADRKPYCEVLGKFPGATQDVHALAIGRTPDLGKQALELLSTLHWQAADSGGATTNP
jgi:hypothetical protein